MKLCLACASRFATESWTCPDCGFSPDVDEGIPVFAPDLAGAVAGYENTMFDAHGGEQAERSFWTQARSSLIVWALGRYARRPRRFLEVGCGTGAVLARLERAFPDLELVGAEALVAGLHLAQRRLTRTALMQFDATRIPFVADFDAVGAFDVIEHIAEDDQVLASMATAVRPGGVLLITVPQHQFLYGPADVSARHVRRYERRRLVGQIRRLGLDVECVTSFVALLFPAMAAVRLRSRWRGGEYDSAEDFTIGALNTLFRHITNLERWTIQQGVRWPFGGSLLMVARRPLAR